jgi:hypothetical protein
MSTDHDIAASNERIGILRGVPSAFRGQTSSTCKGHDLALTPLAFAVAICPHGSPRDGSAIAQLGGVDGEID